MRQRLALATFLPTWQKPIILNRSSNDKIQEFSPVLKLPRVINNQRNIKIMQWCGGSLRVIETRVHRL